MGKKLMGAIEFQDVSFAYGDGAPALSHVTLSIGEGEHVCVVGGNGSGKSTLARLMNALLLPESGTVRAFGRDTRDAAGTVDVRKNVGLVFQNPDDQIVASIVEDEVAFGPENLGIEPAEIRERVTEALCAVGLAGFERRDVSTLSGGEKQRLAVAGALAMRPRALVLDEASSMLDPRGRDDLMRICRNLKAAGLAVVHITHFAGEAAQADRIVALDRGRIVADGTPYDLLAGPDAPADLPLAPPFAALMSRLLRERGIACEGHLRTEQLASELRGMMPGGKEPLSRRLESRREHDRAATSPEGGTPAPARALLAFEGVSFAYGAQGAASRRAGRGATRPSDANALTDITFCLEEGEILGIAGHTGSGKSTLVQLCNGLLTPTAGRVLAGGEDLADARAAARARRRIGVVFQYPEHQLFAATVFEDVAFGPRNLGLSDAEVERRVLAALDMVHLDAAELRDRSPFALSGGQQRRVAMAGVLAMQPEALVFDEPTAGLDSSGRAAFLALLRELNGKGMTVAIVSHDMDDLARICGRVLVLDDGRIRAIGSPAHVFADAGLADIGLAQPDAMKLAGALGLPATDRVPAPEELADGVARAIRNRTDPARLR